MPLYFYWLFSCVTFEDILRNKYNIMNIAPTSLQIYYNLYLFSQVSLHGCIYNSNPLLAQIIMSETNSHHSETPFMYWCKGGKKHTNTFSNAQWTDEINSGYVRMCFRMCECLDYGHPTQKITGLNTFLQASFESQ